MALNAPERALKLEAVHQGSGNPDRCARTVLPRDKPLLSSDENDLLGGNKNAARFVH